MRWTVLKRVVLGLLFFGFLVAEGFLVFYIRRTEARVNHLCNRAEAAALRAEAASR